MVLLRQMVFAPAKIAQFAEAAKGAAKLSTL
jgi:hypothetical protein